MGLGWCADATSLVIVLSCLVLLRQGLIMDMIGCVPSIPMVMKTFHG